MAALLAAQAVSGFHHVLVDVFVADLGLVILDAHLIQRLVQAEVRHNRRHNLVVQELAALLHIQAVNIQGMVAGHNVALLIHAEAAVGISVIGKADIQAVLYHEFLQVLNVRAATIRVDVVAVRRVVHHVSLCAQGVEHRLRNGPGRAVCDIQADLHILEAVLGH